jgi:D-3-phosphoglycerate dehydrogenase
LVSDKLTDEGCAILAADGEFEVDYKPDISPEDLVKEIGQYSALAIRSRTKVTKEVIAAAAKLEVVGRAGVGVDNIDVAEATSRGIIVMNTPDGNTLSTAEQTMSLLLSLARKIAYADRTMKEGRWEKKTITGVELFGKTLGVCGLGRIGREVAKRCQAFGMNVVGYDPFFSKEAASKLSIDHKDTVNEVVRAADVITVHTPINSQTRGMISVEQIEIARPGVMIINCARGGIIDEKALLDGLKSGKVAGAALDVFEKEPLAEDHPFRSMDNVVLTPHLGASTTEAQENVARDVANQIVDALRGTVVRNALNAPSIGAEALKRVRPYLTLGEKLGRFSAQVVRVGVKRLEVAFSGKICDEPIQPITTAVVKGYLETCVSEPVNYVNAMFLAKERGMEVVESRTSETGDFSSLITLRSHREDGEVTEISATLFGRLQPRIVRINDIATEVNPSGNVILIENEDKPGVIGAAAVTLGKAGVNIAELDLERTAPGGMAKTFIQIDGEVEETVLSELRALANILSVTLIRCG